MKCYKTVCEEGGKFYSLFTPTLGLGLEYRLGKTVKAEVGELFVFKSQEQAEEWCLEFASEVVIECKTRSLKPIDMIAQPPTRRGMSLPAIKDWVNDVEAFWKKQGVETFLAPPGTYVTKQLTPIRVVYP